MPHWRKNENQNQIYLFDEPASNLHTTAQKRLLESFKEISKKNYIIFTTHSHYLVKPEWLSGVFIVKNESINYENETTLQLFFIYYISIK